MTDSLIKSFAGVPTPAFLEIEDIKFEVLPPSNINQLELPMVDGALFISKKYGVRTFSAPCSIIADSEDELMYLADDLAAWLDYKEPKPLIFRNKPDITYYAVVSGSTDLDRVLRTGKGTITFVCLDPHGYGTEKSYNFAPQNTDPVIVANNGNKEAFPKLQMTFTKNLTDFAIVADNEALYFGEPFDVTEKTAVDLKPLLINDSGASTTGWSQGLTVDGGQVYGTIGSNGYSFQQANKDYGGSNGIWHGGALIRSLGKEVQDFTCEASIGFQSSAKNQIGRVEIYLLDQNGKKLGKVAMRDTSRNGDHPNFEARIGALNNGDVSVINSYGAYRGVWKNFNGVLRIGRKGKVWSFYIAQVLPQKPWTHHTRYYKEYTDWKNKYGSKVAAIQIHIAQYGTDAPVNQMWVSNIRFTELLAKTSNQVDYVFKKDDILFVDCEKGLITKNGEPYFDDLYPSSKYLKFEKGANGVSVTDTGIKDGTISFSERW
jgi:predicted phage tail component-like protein